MTQMSADWILADDGWLANSTISIDAGTITAITAGRCENHIEGALLPGMTNLHSHVFQRSFAGCSEFAGGGGDFWSWREAMYRVATTIEPDTMAPAAAYLAMLALEGGFTSLVEFHYLQNTVSGAPYAHRPAMAEAIIDGAQTAGIGLTMLFGIYETANFDGSPLQGGQLRFDTSPEAALQMLADAQSQKSGNLQFGLSPHSLRAVSPRALARCIEGARTLGALPIHMHVAEQQGEVAACQAHRGTTPMRWLLDNAPVDENWCLIHSTHTDAQERADMAARGTVAGLCPTTEGNLGDGIFGLREFVQHGGTFGIGTDSHVGVNAFAELRLLEYSQRLRLEKRNVLAGHAGHTGTILWQSAAAGGAHAAARPVGKILAGARADFVAIKPTPETASRGPDFWLAGAIFANDAPAPRDVMVAGQWVVKNGAHIRRESITAAYTRALAKMAS